MRCKPEPAATVVAGATDVGVWINKDLRDIAPAVFIGHLDGLGRIAAKNGTIGIGATASYSDAEAALREAAPGLADYWSRIGGWQIRNMGTVGGNIANGSPIADLPPVLIALGAELVLRKGRERRAIPLEAYFLDYGRQDLAPGEFVEEVRVPSSGGGCPARLLQGLQAPRRGYFFGVRRLHGPRPGGPRGRGAAGFRRHGGDAQTGRGGRSRHCCGRAWGEACLRGCGAGAGAGLYAPISDWRASAEYRALVARNLLKRFYLDRSGTVSP